MTARVTLADVAAHAQVSRATASLVLRNAGNLADGTRERVRASMDALGYVYHRGAAALRANRTQSVGLIVPDLTVGFTAELTIALESALGESGTVTLIANALEDLDRQDLLITSMLERQVDGLLVIPAVGSSASVAERLAASGVPTVIATREIPHPAIAYVGIDNRTGGRLAAEHLLGHGCRSLAYLGGFTRLKPRRDRIAGVRHAIRRAGNGARLEVDVPGPPRGSFGLEATLRLLEAGQLPDAIVCHTDSVAFGVYRALRQVTHRSAQNVHVVSYDDVAEAALWEPPLTTIAASGHEVGLRCADVLRRRIAIPDADPERSLITSHLVVRESCGCPPRGS